MREAIPHLERHLKAAQSKRPSWAVGLWGEAGVGKTFTMQTLLRESPLASLSLHSTLSEKQLASALPRPDKLPLWAEHIFERLGDQAVNPQSLLEAMVAALSGLAPFVLYLEDLHEASAERVEFIVNLAKALSRTKGVGLIVTSRAEPPEPFKSYRLEPLDKPASDELLENLAKGKLPTEALAWVLDRTRGNPLFSLEFWRYLVRQGFFWSDGQSWHWRTPPDDFVPVSVEALISQAVVNAADLASQAVLEARAIFPPGFDPKLMESLWAEVAGVEPETLREARRALEARGVLVGDRFIHPLFQEVVQRETSAERKRSYAARAITLLESGQPEQAAEFLETASLDEAQALGLLERATAKATERGDETARGRWLSEMVKWSPPAQRAEHALRAAQVLRLSNPSVATRMAEIASSASPPDPEAVFLLADLLATQGYIAEAEARMRLLHWSEEVALRWWETQVSVAVQGAQWPRVVELWNLQPHFQTLAKARTRIMIARGHVSMRQLELAQQLLDSVPDFETLEPSVQAMLLNVQGQMHSYRGNPQAALESNRRLIALSRSQNAFSNMLRAMVNYATDCKNLGLYEQIKPILEEAKQLATQVGDVMMYAVILLRLADERMDSGDFEQAETLLLEGQNLLGRHNPLHFLNECQNKLARLYLTWQPPYGATLALKHARAGVSYGRQSQDAHMLTSALSYLARAECLASNPKQGLQVATECRELAQEKGASRAQAWLAYALALEANGQKGEAREALGQARSFQKEPLLLEMLGLEAQRMDGNIEQARKLYEGFVGRGLMGLAHVALRYFPQLAQDSTPEQAIPSTDASTIRFSVLGSVLLEQSGQPLSIRAKKRLEVLAYLLEARIAGRAEVDILELVDMFYPEMPEDRAKLTLRQLIYLIRTNLGPDSIQSTPTGYALGAVASDIEAFLKSGESTLWRGSYLYGLSDGWNANVRDGLLLALRSSAEALINSDPIEAARLGQIWLEMEPYDQDALRLTIQALRNQGNIKAAERVYKQGQERLSEVGESLPKGLEEFSGMAVV